MGLWRIALSLWLFHMLWGCMLVTDARDPLYTSMVGLRQLQNRSQEYVALLDSFLENTQRNLDTIKTLSRQLQEGIGSGAPYDVEHPVGAYKLIEMWDQLSQLLENEHSLEELQANLDAADIPEVEEIDKRGSAAALLRLQRAYSLPTPEVAQGMVQGHQAAPLNLQDAKYIGELALKLSDYGLAVEWFRYALEIEPEDDDLRGRLLFLLARAHYFIGDYAPAVEFTQQALDLDPTNSTIHSYLSHYQKRLRQIQSSPGLWPEGSYESWQRNLDQHKFLYEALCRGQNITDPARDRTLYCRYRSTTVPYAPVKEEVLSLDPRVMMLHDVISDKDIGLIKQMALPTLSRAGVGDPSKPTETDERVSKVGWLWDLDFDNDGLETPMKRLSDLVEFYTGLSTEYQPLLSRAEPFQVINYGLGGQYEPHVDFYEDVNHIRNLPEYLQGTGDRVATFMFYLSDVKKGGATVFSKLNVYVPPVKGAAAFWYNVRRSGEKDHRTQHAGCPVLMGEKWVANKWIREYDQQFRRPCGSTKKATDD